MTAAAGASTLFPSTAEDHALVADIPLAVRGYLREIAKREFESRAARTILIATILVSLVISRLDLDLYVVISGIVAGVAAVTFSFGHILRWQDRRERQLLKIELDYRRQHGKWRWSQ